MRQNWGSYERSAERGPGSLVLRFVVGVSLLVALVSTIGYVFGWFGEAATVAQKELGPSALLRKYEWFKDAAAQLDKKQADIKVYEKRVENMRKDYDGKPRSEWDRTDKEQLSVWESEKAGVVASYNSLVAEYNSQMSKVNWRFANAGDVPAGASPLPREYREYKDQ